jgi:SAM-dependent methyltransferase
VDDFIYDLRWQEDETEWRACARRELALYLLQRFKSRSGKLSILDVGCGTGMLVQQMQAFGNSFGIDVSLKAIEYSRRRGSEQTAVGSAEDLCFRSATFDAVTMIEVLEHVEDDLKALRDIHGLLRPGGAVILTVPAFQMLWSRRDVRLHHKRRYTTDDLKKKITQAGFRPLFCTYIDLFLFPPLWLLSSLLEFGGKSQRLEMYTVSSPRPINALLLRICRFERGIYTHLHFPFGVSIACVAERLESGHEDSRNTAQHVVSDADPSRV